MEAYLIHPEDVPAKWHEIKPLIDKALARCAEDVNGNDLLPSILDRRAYLWLVTDGTNLESVCLGEFCEYPRKKSFYIHAWATKSGHKYDEGMATFNDTVVNFAKINGCDFIEAKVRKGLAKKLKWDDQHSLVTLTL